MLIRPENLPVDEILANEAVFFSDLKKRGLLPYGKAAIFFLPGKGL